MATTNTRPAECCEASVVGRQQNYASAMGEPKGAHACWAERSPEGGFGILHGVATGTASRAIHGAAPSSHSGDAGNLPILAATLAVDVAALTRGCRRAVLPCRLRGGLAAHPNTGGANSYTRGAATIIRGACARCMAREMGPPRRVERRAGAFTHAPVAQSVEPVRSTHPYPSHGGTKVEMAAWVAGSSPAGRNFPFLEVTK